MLGGISQLCGPFSRTVHRVPVCPLSPGRVLAPPAGSGPAQEAPSAPPQPSSRVSLPSSPRDPRSPARHRFPAVSQRSLTTKNMKCNQKKFAPCSGPVKGAPLSKIPHLARTPSRAREESSRASHEPNYLLESPAAPTHTRTYTRPAVNSSPVAPAWSVRPYSSPSRSYLLR